MEAQELVVEQRVKTGKGSAHKSRAKGHVPGVVYGRDIQPISISFEPSHLRTVLKSSHGKNSVLRLNVDGQRQVLAMLKDMQVHPLSRSIIHSDFVQIAEDRPVVVVVPLHLDGRPEGVKAGGLLVQNERAVTVSCLPKDIPVDIKADVTALNIGDALHIKDLVMPQGTTALYKTNYTLAHVVQ